MEVVVQTAGAEVGKYFALPEGVNLFIEEKIAITIAIFSFLGV